MTSSKRISDCRSEHGKSMVICLRSYRKQLTKYQKVQSTYGDQHACIGSERSSMVRCLLLPSRKLCHMPAFGGNGIPEINCSASFK
ncbi:hypothetical protein CTI12_AA427920 [Artemisia annua]|uniref:Uncharacterized protein n=1 Tax=Artemisia annua TaxID=35608 RepID=A0A2U1M1Y9_ARTAN|nr:hypothetical protein CTI12_AA427920 [Artemisia annua]